MNKLEIKKTTTDYQFEHLGIYIDDTLIDIYLFEHTHKETMKGLISAWFIELDSKSEVEYIRECVKIENEEGVSVPILVCPEDLDLWCTVVVAKIIHTKDSVIWEKVGVVKKDNWNTNYWVNSGIRNFEKWTDAEWEHYGSYFDVYNLDDYRWDAWISENWKEEERRRIHNYTHEYFNVDENIDWFKNIPKLIFDKNQYKTAIDKLL
ncbi:MAG: hypothetical protein ACOYWZ_04375 [Bacillota bacterium]